MIDRYYNASSFQSYYERLLKAVDFFSQSLHLEQLSHYGYEMIHEVLELERSCLFIREGGVYYLKSEKGYGIKDYCIDETDKHRKVATLFGRIMITEQYDYFSLRDLSQFSTELVIPLIIKDQMVGFIFSTGWESSADAGRMVLAGALMQLMCKAYENASNFLELEKKNYELDKKVFNLFFINHCSRTLLSELNLDRIYGICIDIIRELTASSVTGFGLYDEVRNRVVIKGYQNILNYRSYYGEFELLADAALPERVVYHVRNDKALLRKVFVDVHELDHLEAEYIVMLIKDRILGFVTIGKPVCDRVYDQTIFDLIETIATSIYISVVNAQLYEKTEKQSASIRTKYETLKNMNRIIRTINSCETIEELCTITTQSIEIGYGVQRGFLCLRVHGALKVISQIGCPFLEGRILEEGHGLDKLKDNRTFFDYGSVEIETFFPGLAAELREGSNCLVVAPLVVDSIALGDEKVLGYLVVISTRSALREEEILLLDTMANSIAPIVHQMRQMDSLKLRYRENTELLLLENIGEKLYNRSNYHINFHIWYAHVPQKAFCKPDLSAYDEWVTYLIGDWIFSPIESGNKPTVFDGRLEVEDIEDFMKQACHLSDGIKKCAYAS